jgi:phosphatidylglycerol:prolipoprotein diacylglycerol transferase
MLLLPFPVIDPVMIHLGPLAVHWYGVAYVAGLLGGRQYAVWIARRYVPAITKNHMDDFMMWALAGIIIGGRLGHILFFEPGRYIENPAEIFMTWKGGMSFHGGLIGVVIAIIVYCRKYSLSILRFGDIIATVTPIGLFLGRLANFVNGELYGRVSNSSWAMVFPRGGSVPRHPSQLYEAFLEGLLLLAILHNAWRFPRLQNNSGRIMGLFFCGYGLARFFVEFVREPDALHTFLVHTPMAFQMTTGQILSLPMIVGGGYFAFRPAKNMPCL